MTVDRVLTALDVILKPAGFRRTRRLWNRAAGDFVDVVDLQIGKALDTFTVNAGVAIPSMIHTVWGRRAMSHYSDPDCVVRTRIARLAFGRDKFWEVADPEAPAEVAAIVREHAIAYLERMHSLRAVEEALVGDGAEHDAYPPPRLYLAMVRHLTGRTSDGCRTLAAGPIPTAWLDHVARVRRELGCDQSLE